MPEEAEADVALCCEGLEDALSRGGIELVEVEPGVYREVIPDRKRKSGVAINFCPFCGARREAGTDAG